MESENMTVCAATQEAPWLSRLLKELGCQFSIPVTLLEGNQAFIYYSSYPGAFQRTKHIDQKYHFVREHVTEGKLYCKRSKLTLILQIYLLNSLAKVTSIFWNSILWFM